MEVLCEYKAVTFHIYWPEGFKLEPEQIKNKKITLAGYLEYPADPHRILRAGLEISPFGASIEELCKILNK